MTLRKILTVPDPALRAIAAKVEKIDDEVRQTLDDMLETMYAAPGVGLAANQIGLTRRFIVADVTWKEDGRDKTPLQLINPEVVWASEERSVLTEGCLSLPQQFAEVERPAIVRVRYQDKQGQTKEIEAEGLLSHCLQHEIDHLNGVLFIDYISKMKRDILLRKLKKHLRDQEEVL